MIDNFKKIRDMLTFETSDDYYFLEIIQRRKDFSEDKREGVKDHKVLRTYFISSTEKLDAVEQEVKALCKMHNARAYINPSVKSKKRTTILLMKECLSMIESDEYSKVESRIASAAGQCPGLKGRRKFVVDIDVKDNGVFMEVLSAIEKSGDAILYDTIPTVNGYHLVTTPFDCMKFSKSLSEATAKVVCIKHNSPTLLYYEG